MAAIEGHLGRPLVGHTTPITIIVDVRQRPDERFGVNLWTVDDKGLHQRHLIDPDCRSIADGAALIAAMAIDVRVEAQDPGWPDVPNPTPPPKLDPPEPTPTEATPPVKPPPVVAAPVRPSPVVAAPTKPPQVGPRKLHGALRLAGGAIYGDLRLPGALIRATPALLLPRWRIELEASYGPARKFALDNGQVATLHLAGGALRAGPILQLKFVEIPLYLGVEVGAMLARGETAINGRKWDTFVAFNILTGFAAIVHPRIALVFALEGAVYVKKAAVYVKSEDPVPPVPLPLGRVAVRGLAGIEFRFP